MKDFIVVKEGVEGIYEEKKSRFIAKVYKTDNESEAGSYIEEARKKYWDARHNCYAYVIGNNNEITRCSDDGEPSGTAGKPILEVITRMGVHNCLIIVTRYFGGTLLGTGGLVRAYTDASVAALNNSRLATQVQGVRYVITTDYNGAGKIQYGMASLDAIIDDTEYTDKVTMKVVIEKEREKLLIDTVTEITNGRAVILKDCELPVEKNISL